MTIERSLFFTEIMSIVITYPSALEYWLLDRGLPRSLNIGFLKESISRNDLLNEPCGRTEMLNALERFRFKKPLHIGVTEKTMRNQIDNLKIHLLPDPLPENSLIFVSDGIYVCSPELCFLQAANELSLPELVFLGIELCAIYCRDEDSEYGQRRRDPLMSLASLEGFLNQANNLHGIKKARRASKYILERSNSPMESRLAAIAVLPISVGGYGIKNTLLNYDVLLSQKGSYYYGWDRCCCDMVWKKEKVVLEYDSKLSHLSVEQHRKDKKRSTALTFSGYKVISLTEEQVKHFRSIEDSFLALRNVLGLKSPVKRISDTMELRREVVNKILFSDPVYEQLYEAGIVRRDSGGAVCPPM